MLNPQFSKSLSEMLHSYADDRINGANLQFGICSYINTYDNDFDVDLKNQAIAYLKLPKCQNLIATVNATSDTIRDLKETKHNYLLAFQISLGLGLASTVVGIGLVIASSTAFPAFIAGGILLGISAISRAVASEIINSLHANKTSLGFTIDSIAYGDKNDNGNQL